MKTSSKKLLPLLLLLASPAVVEAQFTFKTNDGAITITLYTGHGSAVTIPNTTNGYPVTSIGNYAFMDCTSLITVTLGTNVSSIGNGAFLGCSGLNSVTIPDSVTSMGSWAFSSCEGLTSVTIGSSVTSIGDGVFQDCGRLTAITVDPSNPVYSGVDGVLFNKSTNTLVEYPGGKAGTYAVPNSVTSIGDYAFIACEGLTSVTIGNSVTSIGDYAFADCLSLSSATIGSGVTSMGDYTFDDCLSLMGVYFEGNTPVPGGTNVFEYDNNTTVYYLPGTTGWGTTYGGRPIAIWQPQVQTSNASFGVRTNQFGFNINWANGMIVVVEACTNLAIPTWSPVATNTLIGGSSYFSDPQWANYPVRFYRLRSS